MTDRQPTLWLQNLGIAIEVFSPVLACIFVALRLYGRLKKNNFGWDDVLIIVAMVLSIALAVASIFTIKLFYIGMHYWDVPATFDPTAGLLWIYVVGAIYNPILALVKQSVLVFLLRLGGHKTGVLRVVWAISIFNIAEMIAVFFVVLFQCSPVKTNWHTELLAKGATCINRSMFGISTACLTIFTDLFVLAIPIWIFIGLNMKWKTKIALIGVFFLGFIVTLVGIVRLYFLRLYLVQTDPDSSFSLGFVVSAIECNLAIIVACCPALWPLVRTWVPRWFSTYGTYGAYKRKISEAAAGDNPCNSGEGSVPNLKRNTTGGAVYTIGGSEFQLEDLNLKSPKVKDVRNARGDGARGKVDIRASRTADSDEEMLTHKGSGIMMTTAYSVARDDESRKPTSSHGEGGSPMDARFEGV